MKVPRWVDLRTLLLLHAATLAEHGGLSGLRDEGALESAVARAKNLFLYKKQIDLPGLAAAYAFGIIRNHPFNDGNKRVGFLALGLFLALNGCALEVDQAEAAQVIMQLAAGQLSEAELAVWVRHKTKVIRS